MLTSDLERVMRGGSIVPPAPTPGTPAADSSAAAAAGAGTATSPALTAKQHLNSMAYLAACSQEHPPHVSCVPSPAANMLPTPNPEPLR